MIRSDWHIHSDASYDSKLPLREIAEKGRAMGLKRIGIADHVNYNEPLFFESLEKSAENVKAMQSEYPEIILGVELTPVNKPEYDYLAMHGTREGYEHVISDKPLDMELAVSKEYLLAHKVRYAVGAVHWRVDVSDRRTPGSMDVFIRDWHRQQLYLATDERVTILGHPWYIGSCIWYEDFSVIPRSMHDELCAVLLENKKYIECNFDAFGRASEKYHYQYAEFLREMFERGVPVTFGSDCHNRYVDKRDEAVTYLSSAGFKDGDIVEVAESDLW